MDKSLEQLAENPLAVDILLVLVAVVLILLALMVGMIVVTYWQNAPLDFWGLKIGARQPKPSSRSVQTDDPRHHVPGPRPADSDEIKLKRIDHTEKITIGDDYHFQFENRFATITIEALNPELLPTHLGEPQAQIQGVRVRFHTNFALDGGHRTKTIVERTEFVMEEMGSLWSFGAEPNNAYFLRISIERINPTASDVQVRFLYYVGPR